jgi:hypothetical protein
MNKVRADAPGAHLDDTSSTPFSVAPRGACPWSKRAGTRFSPSQTDNDTDFFPEHSVAALRACSRQIHRLRELSVLKWVVKRNPLGSSRGEDLAQFRYERLIWMFI